MAEPYYRYLQCNAQDGVLVLALAPTQLRSGDFDLIDQVRQELLAALALNGTRKVVVDLSGVEYVGSGGFRPLLSLRKKLQEMGGDMLLCGLRPEVREVFQTSRLIDARGSSSAPFGVEPDAVAAVARLTRPANGPKG
ncbi:MAG: STAS domain-containing protein [Gemmataceae bacterium]|nr:STAS domain-containing protein [Gemmataceae bacterium]